VRVLVTGADGFVGRHLLRALVEADHVPIPACRPGGPALDLPVVPLELTDYPSVRAVVDAPVDAIVHLAAVAYSREAQLDPGQAWNVNAGGTARLLAAVAYRGRCLSFRRHFDPRLYGADICVGNPLAVLVFAALSCHHTGAGGDFGKPHADAGQHAGLPRAILRA